MKVDNPDDRQETPEECDWCGSMDVELQRFTSYGPGHQVDWLCKYCMHSLDRDSSCLQSMACMLHELEKSLKGN